MQLKKLNTLDQITVRAFEDAARRTPTGATFQAPVTIDALSQNYAIQYQNTGGIGTSAQPATHGKTEPRKMQFNILLDNTVLFQSEIGAMLPPTKSIVDRVEDFMGVCYDFDGSLHSPKFLKAEWGELKFDCKLEVANVQYSLFDKGGHPQRAELDVTFIEDKSEEAENLGASRTSPDITHTRVFKAGDTLPLIAKKVYGSSSFYLLLAKANNIDHFREIQPGAEIKLPPKEELEDHR